MLKKFISYYKPYKGLFIADLLVAIIAAASDLVYPVMTRALVNNYIPKREYKVIWIFAAVLLIIYFIKMACNYFMTYWGHLLGLRMQKDMRRDVFLKLQNLPVRYYDNNTTGSIMSKIINDLQEVTELAHHGPEDLLISVIMIVGSFLMLFSINIPLTLIIFSIIPLAVIFTVRRRQKMEMAFTETREKIGLINSNLQNSISGIRVSKAFVNRNREIEKFQESNTEFKNARKYAYKVMAEYTSGMSFFVDILDYASLIGGAVFTYTNKINFGDYLAYLLYIKIFSQPLKRLVAFVEQYQNGMSGFKRFMSLMQEDEEKSNKDGDIVEKINGEIEFKDVNFSHENKKVLSNLNLTIEAGKMIALVGPSGGGKTTFCNLIPRFYDVDDGDIKIDGKSIYTLKLDFLRESVGIVQQEPFLFTGTVKENILIGKPGAMQEEVESAAKEANIHEFISNLPDGYETQVGERGVKLSGGQKQRLAIARVFLKNPAILILDEATSALDNITEKLIQESLDHLCHGRTTIVVAHRLSTIKNADKIVVLTDEGIAEVGTHEELIEKEGIYYDLHTGIIE